MSRIRLAGIIPMKDGFALMHRKDVKKNPERQEYYVFPGGGQEKNETFEEGITLLALVITTIFSYDENIRFSNSKGFLLQTI